MSTEMCQKRMSPVDEGGPPSSGGIRA